MFNHCAQAENAGFAMQALEILNAELPKAAEDRDDLAIEVCISGLEALDAQYQTNEDQTRIEICQFDCAACKAPIQVEDSDPLMVMHVPDRCPDNPGNNVITVTQL